MPLLSLTYADDRPLAFPAHGVLGIQEIPPGGNETFPNARAVVRYNIGQGVCRAIVLEEAEATLAKVQADPLGPKAWVLLTFTNGSRIWVQPAQIVGLRGLEAEEVAEHPGALTRWDIRLGERGEVDAELWGYASEPAGEILKALESFEARPAREIPTFAASAKPPTKAERRRAAAAATRASTAN